jgi:hypothetical protein
MEFQEEGAPMTIVKCLIAAALLFSCVALSWAGQNPGICIYLDADPPNGVHRIEPQTSQTFDVYVCLKGFGWRGGTRGTAFLFERTFSGFKLAQESLLDGLDFGDVEVDGWTIAAGADCAYPPCAIEGILVIARVTYLYLGVPGTLTLLPHPGTGRQTLDCDFNDDDLYCIRRNLGVWTDPIPGEECSCIGWWPPHAECEPQIHPWMEHPPHYFYRVYAASSGTHGFHVQVFDPQLSDYSQWETADGWCAPDSVKHLESGFWLSWCDPELDDPLWSVSPFTFQFYNENPTEWGHWTMTGPSDPCDPLGDVLFSSWDFAGCEDGYGYRVHVPIASTPVRETSWGTLKALYR